MLARSRPLPRQIITLWTPDLGRPLTWLRARAIIRGRAYVVPMLTFTPSRRRTARRLAWSLRWAALALFVVVAPAIPRAQWLNYPTPGIPRLANGAPDL